MPDHVELDLLAGEGVELDLVDTEVTLNVEQIDVTLEVVGEVGPRGPQGEQGIQGIQGETGPMGPIGGNYRHSQALPATTWLVEHNLGFYPSVSVTDSAGTVVVGDVQHLDDTTLTISFAFSFGGYANLS